ncbi:hypothetical protein [Sphingomonas arantia]
MAMTFATGFGRMRRHAGIGWIGHGLVERAVRPNGSDHRGLAGRYPGDVR